MASARERATVSLRVRRRPFEEVEDIEYRLQSVPDARALRVVLARLSRGRVEDEDAEFFHDVVPGLGARVLRAGTLMRRIGRVALSDAETAAGRGGGRWTTCAALCVPGKLILLAKQPSVPEPLDERPGDARESLRSERAPAPAVATGGRASPLAIHFAASLADARVVSRAPRWTPRRARFWLRRNASPARCASISGTRGRSPRTRDSETRARARRNAFWFWTGSGEAPRWASARTSSSTFPRRWFRRRFPVVRTVEREDANGACSFTSMSSAMPWICTWIRAYDAVADETKVGDSGPSGVRAPR